MRPLSAVTLMLFASSFGLVACTGPRGAQPAQVAEDEPRMELVALRYADATQTCSVLAHALANTGVRVQPDARTNSLIVVGRVNAVTGTLELIAKLDVEAK